MSGSSTSRNKQASTWLALGDSYTIGEEVSPEQRWPTLLTRWLELAQPHYVAQTGWTTGELLIALKSEDLPSKYDWASLLIGVNNQYRNLDTKEYQSEFEQLVEFAQSRVPSPGHLLILSIPDYSVTPFGQAKDAKRIAREIDAYNAINYEVAQRKGCQYCNITPISRKAKTDFSLVAEDDLHPSPVMYQMWVREILVQCRFTD